MLRGYIGNPVTEPKGGQPYNPCGFVTDNTLEKTRQARNQNYNGIFRYLQYLT